MVDAHGVAYSGSSGAHVTMVEVSTDLGKSWHPAAIHRGEVLQDDSSKAWHWVRWSASVEVDGAAARAIRALPSGLKRKDPSDPNDAPRDDVNVPSLALPAVRAGAFAKTSRPPAFPVPSQAPQVWCRAFTDQSGSAGAQEEVSEWRGGYNYNGYHKVHIEPPPAVYAASAATASAKESPSY